MPSLAFDDFIDDCFLGEDDICKFKIYRSRKYENRINPIASQLIATKQNTGSSNTTFNSDWNHTSPFS
tara:strand:+ start:250 stop:453 length:204 start_codon:yes stop_codon:yes gene_type:complete